MKNHIKKSLVISYLLALASCSTMRNNMDIQKSNYEGMKNILGKYKLIDEAKLAYDEAVKAADTALDAVDAAWAKVRVAAPEDKAAVRAAAEAAEAEEEAKSAAAEAAYKAVARAHDAADAAYRTAYPEEAKARDAVLAPAIAAAGHNVAARAAVYGRFALEVHAKTATSRDFVRDYLQVLNNIGNISVNPPDPKDANTEKTHTKAVAGRGMRPQSKDGSGVETGSKRFARS
jgi:hypothetical protein